MDSQTPAAADVPQPWTKRDSLQSMEWVRKYDASVDYSTFQPMESCAAMVAMSGVGGTVMGAGLGLVLGSLDSSLTHDPKYQSMTTRQQMKQAFLQLRGRAWSQAKMFGKIGAVYSAFHCAIEKGTGQHSIANSVAAGCFAGSALALQQGPSAMVMGCAGFAAFSAAIDAYMAGYLSFDDSDD